MDLASTILFFCLYALTRNITLAVTLGLALAIAQIGWQLLRRKPVDALQWVSLVVVIASGSATLITRNPVFVMVKPSLIYLMVGAAMLKRGWMNRYLPPRALEIVPDLAIFFGYAWAGLMFFSAALNLVLALSLSVTAWGAAMSVWGIASKSVLFFVPYGVMKTVGRRRYYARAASCLRRYLLTRMAGNPTSVLRVFVSRPVGIRSLIGSRSFSHHPGRRRGAGAEEQPGPGAACRSAGAIAATGWRSITTCPASPAPRQRW